MQVLCKATNGNAELHCCICGQGFVMFWDRQSRNERVAALQDIRETLRRHHHTVSGVEAHPNASFPVPDWNGSSEMTGAAQPGGETTWGI